MPYFNSSLLHKLVYFTYSLTRIKLASRKLKLPARLIFKEEKMNKGTFAFLYVIISSLINIVYSLVVCAVVVSISMLMMKHLSIWLKMYLAQKIFIQ